MAYADKIFKDNLLNILENGDWDKDYNVRPKWEDGTPSYTKYITGVFNTYNIAKDGIPITTLRPVAWKTAFKEILWIYKDKSNDVNLLKTKYGVNYWDSWMDESGTLGKSYAYQLSKITDYPEGTFDQVDRIIYLLKNDPMNRRMITNMLNLEEMKDMTLAPCAFMTQWSVRGEYLDMTLIQRSSDVIAALSINVIQYSFLLVMMAQACGYKPGKLNHYINNMHIYDRHVPIAEELLIRNEFPQPKIWINPDIDNFYHFTPDDIRITEYNSGEQFKGIEIAI